MSEITQQNLYLLLPFKVSWVADMLAEDEHISTIEAIRRVYSSAMYKQLEQESTKRWQALCLCIKPYNNLSSLTDVKYTAGTDNVKKR